VSAAQFFLFFTVACRIGPRAALYYVNRQELPFPFRSCLCFWPADDDGALDHRRVVSTAKTSKRGELTLASETEYLLAFERQLVGTFFSFLLLR